MSSWRLVPSVRDSYKRFGVSIRNTRSPLTYVIARLFCGNEEPGFGATFVRSPVAGSSD